MNENAVNTEQNIVVTDDAKANKPNILKRAMQFAKDNTGTIIVIVGTGLACAVAIGVGVLLDKHYTEDDEDDQPFEADNVDISDSPSDE